MATKIKVKNPIVGMDCDEITEKYVNAGLYSSWLEGHHGLSNAM